MISIDEIRNLAYSVAAKQRAAYPSIDDFNRYCNLASIDRFNYWNDIRRKALLKVRTGVDIAVPAVLNPFLTVDQVLTFTSGTATLDVADVLSVSKGANKSNVKLVDYDKRNNVLNSSIDGPTEAEPVVMRIGTGLLVYPNTITELFVTSLKYPATVKWNYTLGTNNRPVYNSTGTVDFEWGLSEKIPLLMAIVKYMGISITDSALVQIAEQQLQTSN